MSRENYCKKLTPAMQQVKKFKSEYPDCILFIRIGDFYETFFEDAEICAKELDIVLTSHSKDADGNPIPLAGVPYHAVDTYLPRMIRRGYKVAICEQMEDPKLAKGVVKRDVIKVVTPGTAIDADIIPGGAAHYLMSLCTDSDSNSKLKLFGLAFIDITTGEFFVKEAEFDKNYQSLATEIERYNPLEILVSKGISAKLIKYLASTCRVITPIKESLFANGKDVLCRQFHVESLDGFDTSSELCINAAGAALSYIKDTQKTDIPYIKSFSKRYDSGRMVLDAVTLKNLEILSPLHGDRN
ncbi:MAG TPA: DNA mismatch repair protein MutS, partial [Methanocorpusculum sp.]|nr:DNA mismatch repair protein MutS [Methanocorpusculum sp.]